jgi:hypothetical protein
MDSLDRLFSEYRDAFPDPEPSAAFTPGIWRRIDARRPPARFVRRMAEAFVALSATVTLLIGLFLIPHFQSAPVYSANYVDVLAADHADALDANDAPDMSEGIPQ